MNKKIIFFDLDGTLIDHEINGIPHSTKKTIKELKKRGHHIAIATGRPPGLAYQYVEELEINTLIASNGRYVKYGSEVIKADYIDYQTLVRFENEMHKLGYDLAFESENEFVVNRVSNDLVYKFCDYFNLDYPKADESFHLNYPILQIVMFFGESDFSFIAEKFPELSFNRSCPYGIDINKANGMKEVGVQAVLDYLNFDHKDVIAVGDGYNDISMIKMAAHGIAMGNACQALKDVADSVTDSCNQDGIYKAFKKLHLID